MNTTDTTTPDPVSPPSPDTPAPSGIKKYLPRIAAIVCALFLLFHFTSTFLWETGKNQLRTPWVDSVLQSYMLPMFGQSWAVFAPNPISVDHSFEVRARLRDDAGNVQNTGWIKVTDQELQKYVHHHLIPSRINLQTPTMASDLFKSNEKLSKEGQKAIAENLLAGGYGPTDNNPSWLATEKQLLKDSNSSTAAINQSVRDQRIATGLATVIAQTTTDKEVVAVQFRAVKQGVVSFENRHNPNVKRPDPSYLVFGWRPSMNTGSNVSLLDHIYRSES